MNHRSATPDRLLLASLSIAAGASLAMCPAVADANTFAPYINFPTVADGEAVAIGDVDGDGDNDVVMTTGYASSGGYKVQVYRQDGGGQLAAPVEYDTLGSYTARPKTVGIGDIDGDGRNDVVVGNSESTIQLFTQDGSGQLASTGVINTIYSDKLCVGDLDNDGLADVTGIPWIGTDAGVFLQDSAGAVALSGTYYAPNGGYEDLAIGDVNGDGLTDIVVMSGQGNVYDDLAVLTQSPAGGFDPVVSYALGVSALASGVGIGDVNGDGLSDVVVSYGGNRPDSHIAIFLQNTAGTLDAAVSLPSYDIPGAVEIADVTGDGRGDVLVLHDGWSRLGLYVQQSDGSLAAEQLYPIPYNSHYNPHGLAVGDIDNNGSPDVVIGDHNNGLVVLYNTTPFINQLPVVVATSTGTYAQGSIVTLDGSGSYDPDGTVTDRTWTQLDGPVVQLTSAGTDGVVTFQAPWIDGQEELVFELVVTDNQGATAMDAVSITVTNEPPIADAGPDHTVKQRSTALLDGTASYDADGPLASFAWTQVSGPAVSLTPTSTSGVVAFQAPKLRSQPSIELIFELMVTDLSGFVTTDQVAVIVVKH